MEQAFTLKDIVDNTWVIAAAGVLFWLVGGAIFRNIFANWFTQYRKDNPCITTEYVDGDYKQTKHHEVNHDDICLIFGGRMFFPISLVVWLVFLIGYTFVTGNFKQITKRVKK